MGIKSPLGIYEALLSRYGPQGWWPIQNNFKPPEWEICVGAILTQNTSWNNVEKALDNLKNNNCVSVRDILDTRRSELERLLKPSGFFRQKSKTLKLLAKLVNTFNSFEDFKRNVTRGALLKLNGIGPETADSILLYACGKPSFVVDAYTRRIFHRLGLVGHDAGYEKIRDYLESNLPKDASLYNEFHALIVRLGKEACRKSPLCMKCPLEDVCEKRGFP
ncbi:MAG: endonuclease III domain-containing protein [Candidatus Aenigmarchaeota archaeon]|nr:endonuclease III domain-containing protein [Candidatus Aenigmarchaeota archaeon]